MARWPSLKPFLFAVLLALGIIPAAVIMAAVVPGILHAQDEAARQSSLAQAQSHARTLTERLERRRETVRNLAMLPAPLEMLRAVEGTGAGLYLDVGQAAERFSGVLRRWFNPPGDFRRLSIFEPGGREVFRSDVQGGQVRRVLPFGEQHGLDDRYRAIMTSAEEPSARVRGDAPVLEIVAPIRALDGEAAGLLVMEFGLADMLGDYTTSIWADGDGRSLGSGEPVLAVGPTPAPMIQPGEAGRMVAWVPLRLAAGPRDILWIGTPVDPAGLQQALVRLGGVVVIAFIVLAVMGALGIGWLVRRLDHFKKELTLGLGRIVDGVPGVRFHWGGPPEIRALAAEMTHIAEDHSQALGDLRKTVSELTASNAELERFAYVAAHDLQEPVRTVVSFAQLVERRAGAKLDGEDRDNLRFVVDGALRMRDLVQDLLAYSRVKSQDVHVEVLGLDEVLGVVLDDLKPLISERGVQVHAGPLPMVRGQGAQLAAVLRNLLTNAIKFARDGVAPEIHISAERKGEEWEIAVADNGIGMEPDETARIFDVFVRLHGARYPGTGIGLAICRQVVERHGGRIWVETAPGRGAVFRFTLPATMLP